MTDFEKVLMNRDGMTEEEAREERLRAREEMMEMIEDDMDPQEVEDYLADEFGLEPDYLMDILF